MSIQRPREKIVPSEPLNTQKIAPARNASGVIASRRSSDPLSSAPDLSALRLLALTTPFLRSFILSMPRHQNMVVYSACFSFVL